MALKYDNGRDNNSRYEDYDSEFVLEWYSVLFGAVNTCLMEWDWWKIKRAFRATGRNAGWRVWGSFPGGCRLLSRGVFLGVIGSTG